MLVVVLTRSRVRTSTRHSRLADHSIADWVTDWHWDWQWVTHRVTPSDSHTDWVSNKSHSQSVWVSVSWVWVWLTPSPTSKFESLTVTEWLLVLAWLWVILLQFSLLSSPLHSGYIAVLSSLQNHWNKGHQRWLDSKICYSTPLYSQLCTFNGGRQKICPIRDRKIYLRGSDVESFDNSRASGVWDWPLLAKFSVRWRVCFRPPSKTGKEGHKLLRMAAT